MLSVGEKFPSFSVTATVGIEKDPAKAFRTITDMDYPGKWKVYFFWPKDFTFVCPTEIAAFGKLNKQFRERDTQILGAAPIPSGCTMHGAIIMPICETCHFPCWPM